MEQRLTKRLGVGQSVGQRWCFVFGPHSTWLSGIKKPACGRLLGDWLGLFLVSLASLQNVHPDLRPAVGLGQTLVCRVGRHLSRGSGRCANVGRRILSFALDSQCEVRVRATAAVQIRILYCFSGPLRGLAGSHSVLCEYRISQTNSEKWHHRPPFAQRRPPEHPTQYMDPLLFDLCGAEDFVRIFSAVVAAQAQAVAGHAMQVFDA
ncbi:hypothetical protein PS906_03247 [Pseudomonas fluorescens]|nr:hypothetical protein PS906_03247 [Pseudomonas fluorescens]